MAYWGYFDADVNLLQINAHRMKIKKEEKKGRNKWVLVINKALWAMSRFVSVEDTTHAVQAILYTSCSALCSTCVTILVDSIRLNYECPPDC